MQHAAQRADGERRRQDAVEILVGKADDAVHPRLVGDEEQVGRRPGGQADRAVREAQRLQHVAAAVDDEQRAAAGGVECREILQRGVAGADPARIGAPGVERLDELADEILVLGDDQRRQMRQVERQGERRLVDRERQLDHEPQRAAGSRSTARRPPISTARRCDHRHAERPARLDGGRLDHSLERARRRRRSQP